MILKDYSFLVHIIISEYAFQTIFSVTDIIENFQSITRTEAKKSGSAAKIECVVSR